MTELARFDAVLTAMLLLSLVVFAVLWFVDAPYGRHVRAGWGPTLPSTLGWMLMEAPASLVFLAVYLLGPARAAPVPLVLLGLWQAHYLDRGFVYPLSRRGGKKPMPLFVVVLGVTFNAINGWLNARFITRFMADTDELWRPHLVLGALLFVVGFLINRGADRVLRELRRPGEEGYTIPQRGLHRLVASPNYFGEIIAWCGFAIAAWSPAALVFVFWTVANLAPRARAHRRWYRQTFPDYPRRRRALVPYLF